MQEFKNVINESLLKEDSDTIILSVIPLPELHLLMGLVNWAVEFMYKVVPKADLLVKMEQKGITVHGYHGGGLDGVNSNLFLKHLNHLEDESDPMVAPIFQILRYFHVVKQSFFCNQPFQHL